MPVSKDRPRPGSGVRRNPRAVLSTDVGFVSRRAYRVAYGAAGRQYPCMVRRHSRAHADVSVDVRSASR